MFKEPQQPKKETLEAQLQRIRSDGDKKDIPRLLALIDLLLRQRDALCQRVIDLELKDSFSDWPSVEEYLFQEDRECTKVFE